jgi:hypothetical protein
MVCFGAEMIGLIMRGYLELVRFDIYIARDDFAALCEKVRRTCVQATPEFFLSCEQICHAADLACMWYWKRVLCLHRSAVLTRLLRRQGMNAELVIASRRLPFQAHAWVEVEGRVVNEQPDVHEKYVVLERC